MALSDYFENIVLNFVFGKVPYVALDPYTLGLSLADPQEDGSGLSEPSGAAGYSRITVYPLDWLNASDGVVANRCVFAFPTALDNWGLIQYFALLNVEELLIRGELDPHVQVYTGQRLRFAVAKLEILMH